MAAPEGEVPQFEEGMLFAKEESPQTEAGAEASALPSDSPLSEMSGGADEAAVPTMTSPSLGKGRKKKTVNPAVLAERRAMRQKAAKVYLTLSGLMGIPFACIALGHFKFLEWPVAVALCGALLMPWALWSGRKTNNVYTTFLGLTVAAMLAGVCFMWTELARYQFDVRAKTRNQPIATSKTPANAHPTPVKKPKPASNW